MIYRFTVLACLFAACSLGLGAAEHEHPVVSTFLDQNAGLSPDDLYTKLVVRTRDYFNAGDPLMTPFARVLLETAEETGNPALKVEAYFYRAYIALYENDYESAERYLLATLNLAEKIDFNLYVAYSYLGMAQLAGNNGDMESFRNLANKAYTLAIETVPVTTNEIERFAQFRLHFFNSLSGTLRTLGEYDRAENVINRIMPSLSERREEYPLAYMIAMVGLGDLAKSRGDYQRALQLYQDTVADFEGDDFTDGIAWAEHRIARLLYEQDDFREALPHSRRAVEISENLQIPMWRLQYLETLAAIHDELGNHAEHADTLLTKIELMERMLADNTSYQPAADVLQRELISKENELLRQKMESQQQIIASNRSIVVVVGVALVLSLILGAILLRNLIENSRIKRRVEDSLYKLEEAHRELEIFNYTVSHDLRSPAQTILGFVDLLRKNGEFSQEERQRFVNRIGQSAERSIELIDDLMDLSMISSKQLELEQVDLELLAKQVLSQQKSYFTSQIVKDSYSGDLLVTADRRFITILLENTIGNSLKYSQERPTTELSIRGEKRDGEHLISISDNGIGFDGERADDIFKAFTRLHTGQQFRGSGIGLATSKRIIKRHGGRIWAESAVNQGTTIHFTIPLKHEEST